MAGENEPAGEVTSETAEQTPGGEAAPQFDMERYEKLLAGPEAEPEEKSEVTAEATTEEQVAKEETKATTVDRGLAQLAEQVGLTVQEMEELGPKLPTVVAAMRRSLEGLAQHMTSSKTEEKPKETKTEEKPTVQPYKLQKLTREIHEPEIVDELEAMNAHYQGQIDKILEQIKPLVQAIPRLNSAVVSSERRAEQEFFDQFDAAVAGLNLPEVFGEGRSIDLADGPAKKARAAVYHRASQLAQMYESSKESHSLEELARQAALLLGHQPGVKPNGTRSEAPSKRERNGKGEFVALTRARNSAPPMSEKGDGAALEVVRGWMKANGRS